MDIFFLYLSLIFQRTNFSMSYCFSPVDGRRICGLNDCLMLTFLSFLTRTIFFFLFFSLLSFVEWLSFLMPFSIIPFLKAFHTLCKLESYNKFTLFILLPLVICLVQYHELYQPVYITKLANQLLYKSLDPLIIFSIRATTRLIPDASSQ